MTFRYIDDGNEFEGSLRVIKSIGPLEMYVEANGWEFHVIAGRKDYGYYICIPNWSIGSELASLSDQYWNYERLSTHTELDSGNAMAISCALAEVERSAGEKWMKSWG